MLKFDWRTLTEWWGFLFSGLIEPTNIALGRLGTPEEKNKNKFGKIKNTLYLCIVKKIKFNKLCFNQNTKI